MAKVVKRKLKEVHPDTAKKPKVKNEVVAKWLIEILEAGNDKHVDESKRVVEDMKRVVDQFTKKKAIPAIPYHSRRCAARSRRRRRARRRARRRPAARRRV